MTLFRCFGKVTLGESAVGAIYGVIRRAVVPIGAKGDAVPLFHRAAEADGTQGRATKEGLLVNFLDDCGNGDLRKSRATPERTLADDLDGVGQNELLQSGAFLEGGLANLPYAIAQIDLFQARAAVEH